MPSQNIVSLGEREALIRAMPVFQKLNVSEISELASIMQEEYVTANQLIVKEGDLIDAIYIIATGNFEVTKEVVFEGKTGSTFLAILHAGESIGLKDAGLYTITGRRTATVKSQEPGVLLKINIKDFDNFLNKYPHHLESVKSSTNLMLRMQFIKESNPFSHLSNQHIAWLASSVKSLRVERDEIIFKQHEIADNCYMIVEGIVEISTALNDGTTKTIATLRDGQLFGEQAFFSDAKRSATAKALTPCNLMILDKETLEELREEMGAASGKIFPQTSTYSRPVRMENIIYHQRTLADGESITTLKDTVNNRYLQLNDESWYIWQILDGQMTVQEISERFSKHFGRFEPQTVINTINMLIDSGFAKADIMQSDEDAAVKNKSTENVNSLFQWLYVFKNPDKKFTKLYKNFGFLFYFPPILLAVIGCAIAGLIIYPQMLDGLFKAIQKADRIIFFLIWVVFLSAALNLINPLTKALTVKYFGHAIPQFAIGLRFLLPFAIVNTSDLWASSRFQRCMTIMSGIIAVLFIASLLTLYLYFYPNSVFSVTISMCTLLLYFFTLRSLDPLLNSDGYLTLINALDVSELRESALSAFDVGHKKSFGRKKNAKTRYVPVFYIYYMIYVLLNIMFFYVVQIKLRPFGLNVLWNNGLIYVLLLLGLLAEFFVELSHLRKLRKILTTG